MSGARGLKGIKKPHPLGSVPTRSGVSQLTVVASADSATASVPGVKISELPAGSAANSTDQLEVNQAGTSRRLTLEQIATTVADIAPPGPSQPLVLEDFDAVGDGVADDSDAMDAALAALAATGRRVLMFASYATYKVTREFVLNDVTLLGDGSQTFLQVTAGLGVFTAQDDVVVDNLRFEYREGGVVGARTAPTGLWLGLSAFQRICPVQALGSRIKVANLHTLNFFTTVCLRGPVVTANYTVTGITVGATTTVTSTAHGLTVGGRGYLTGVVGPTALNNAPAGVTVINPNTLSLDINSTGYPAYVSGGTLVLYDFTPLSDTISVSNCTADTCDFMVTGGQYRNGTIEGLRWTNQTTLTVPPHMIYLQSAGYGPTNSEGYCERFTVRDCKGTNSAVLTQPLLKFSNVKDFYLDDCEVKDSYGIMWSRASRCTTIGFQYNASEGAAGSEALRFSDDCVDCEVNGGTLLCGGDSVRLTEASQVRCTGTKAVDNHTGGTARGKMFRAENTSVLTLVDVSGHSRQVNNDYMLGTSGTGNIIAQVAGRTGSAGLIRVGPTTTATLQYDQNFCPAFVVPPSLSSIRNDGTLTLTAIPSGVASVKTVLADAGSPTILIGATPATATYSSSTRVEGYAAGALATFQMVVRLSAYTAGPTGALTITGLPWTVYDSSGSGNAPVYVIPLFVNGGNFPTFTATGLTGTPVTPPVFAELQPGTTTFKPFYLTYAAVGPTRVYLTETHLTAAFQLWFGGTYRRVVP